MEDTSKEKIFWSCESVRISVSSMGFVSGDSSMFGFICLYWMWKSLNTSLDGKFRGKRIESRMMISPLSLPNASTPLLVFSPAEVLKLSVGNPCSLVQFKKVLSLVLKHTNSLSVLMISSSGWLFGKIQNMLLESRAQLSVWKLSN